jgi:hypothetical protein
MHTENNEELFSIRVNEEAKAYLLKIAKVVNVFFALGIGVILLSLVRALVSIAKQIADGQDNFLSVFFSIYSYFSIAAMIVFGFQIFYYKKFAEAVKYAVANTDEKYLNASFQSLLKGTWHGLLVCIFSLIFTVADLFVMFRFW